MTLSFIGFPGAGKSTLAKELSQKYAVAYVDTDLLLEAQYQLCPRQLWALLGEKEFRECEKQVVLNLKKAPQVIATGGGIGLCAESVAHLKTLGEVIYLKVPFNTISARLEKKGWPLSLDPMDREQLFKERALLYEKHANYILPWDQQDGE